ncbi:MFS transporter [Brevibacterium litoralis]|uniref:MFS transporter n=1 Tax=Brevibacterium litoralis TaxID=3138935 RepID=UPI0032EFD1F4
MTGRYREILALPGALAFSIAGLIARFPISFLGLGILLFVQGVTGSYGTAGGVVAAYFLAQALANPFHGKRIDRLGQAKVMVPLCVINVSAIVLLMLTVYAGLPLLVTGVFAAIAGASIGAVGSLIRARWSHVTRTPKQLDLAFSWEAVLDEILFVSGPIIVTALATALFPPAGLILSILTTTVGSFLLYRQTDTEPPAVPKETDKVLKGKVLSNPGILLTVVAHFLLGAAFGAIDVVAVAFAEEQGHKELSGLLLAAFALGSLFAGLVFGAIDWKIPTHRRQAMAVTFYAALTWLLLIPANFWGFMGLLFVAGAGIAPALISTSTSVKALAPTGRLTEAFAWMTTFMGAGAAAGSAVGGMAIDAFGARPSFLVPVACTTIAALLVNVFVTLMNPTKHGHEARKARRLAV